jgi:hypothetical protein
MKMFERFELNHTDKSAIYVHYLGLVTVDDSSGTLREKVSPDPKSIRRGIAGFSFANVLKERLQ